MCIRDRLKSLNLDFSNKKDFSISLNLVNLTFELYPSFIKLIMAKEEKHTFRTKKK